MEQVEGDPCGRGRSRHPCSALETSQASGSRFGRPRGSRGSRHHVEKFASRAFMSNFKRARLTNSLYDRFDRTREAL